MVPHCRRSEVHQLSDESADGIISGTRVQNKRWSLGKTLFIWSRYYSLASSIGTAFHRRHKARLNIAFRCFRLILELRLWAMYGSTKKVATFFCLLTAMEAVGYGVIFSKHPMGLTYADVRHGHLIAYGWTIGVSVDSILLGFTLYKTFQHSREGRMEGGLMQLLTRDQTLFFFPILGIFVTNQVIWLVNHTTINEVATGYAVGLSAVLAHRLMISVRVSYYSKTECSNISGMLPSIRFEHGHETTRTRLTNFEEQQVRTRRDIVEMDQFNDQQGV
ncbi:hypothetical protein PUNSTDRAFT_47012 [Punctularia strigosozonata HHB-11173 SS5]|uniref:Uncharacterized protein n=1 Tax=Punctularia strigosozonata (strain HHB-11173) TaxID=741275 RepID=R7S4L3_PUNST|nr:uncharacterized protein PUNSTDRAFT_47012 [Punctularia strigosozonata HHB-11173 SS5]EIN05173.1 hypothetical protein PUNSTDRAFT_47012 [Punctularia strigosozonata HHB-11173 SS5]